MFESDVKINGLRRKAFPPMSPGPALEEKHAFSPGPALEEEHRKDEICSPGPILESAPKKKSALKKISLASRLKAKKMKSNSESKPLLSFRERILRKSIETSVANRRIQKEHEI